MAAAGFTPEDYAADPVEVWPDCWPAVSLYQRISGQWRYSMGGPAGLDYGPLFTLLDRMHLPDADWQALFADVQVIEAAALEAMHKKA